MLHLSYPYTKRDNSIDFTPTCNGTSSHLQIPSFIAFSHAFRSDVSSNELGSCTHKTVKVSQYLHRLSDLCQSSKSAIKHDAFSRLTRYFTKLYHKYVVPKFSMMALNFRLIAIMPLIFWEIKKKTALPTKIVMGWNVYTSTVDQNPFCKLLIIISYFKYFTRHRFTRLLSLRCLTIN